MTFYIKSWQLTDLQSIHITNKDTLTFRHEAKRHGGYRGITIPISAINILKDFANIVERDPHSFRMPLDGKVWIEHKQGNVKLSVLSTKREGVDYRFFRFNATSWKDFIKHILPQIISFENDTKYGTGDGCKSYAYDEGCVKIESHGNRVKNSRKRRVYSSWQKNTTRNKSTSGATNDADMESEAGGENIDYPILS